MLSPYGAVKAADVTLVGLQFALIERCRTNVCGFNAECRGDGVSSTSTTILSECGLRCEHLATQDAETSVRHLLSIDHLVVDDHSAEACNIGIHATDDILSLVEECG